MSPEFWAQVQQHLVDGVGADQDIPGMTLHNSSGFLVAIEGIDGAGKTTQAHFVQAALQARKLTVIRTKEPTDGKWGQILRDSALTGRLSLEEEIEIFMKDRQEHVEQVIMPSLRQGHIVLADRYYFSTAAYQGARGVNPSELIQKNEKFAPEPDLVIVLDIDPTIGLERIRTRGDRANHFETTDTLKRARDIFLSIQKPYLHILDATESPADIKHAIMVLISRKVADRIAKSGDAPEEKLNATLKLFGGDPIQ